MDDPLAAATGDRHLLRVELAGVVPHDSARLPVHTCCDVDVNAPAPTSSSSSSSSGPRSRLWPRGTVLKVLFLNGDRDLQLRVFQAARQWSIYGNIHFVECGPEDSPRDDADIRVVFNLQPPHSSSWCLIGTDARSKKGTLEPTVSLGNLTADSDDAEVERQALHAFGHVIGLTHEHRPHTATPTMNGSVASSSSPSSPGYECVPWDPERVYAHYAASYGWSRTDTMTKVLHRYNDQPRIQFPQVLAKFAIRGSGQNTITDASAVAAAGEAKGFMPAASSSAFSSSSSYLLPATDSVSSAAATTTTPASSSTPPPPLPRSFYHVPASAMQFHVDANLLLDGQRDKASNRRSPRLSLYDQVRCHCDCHCHCDCDCDCIALQCGALPSFA